VGNRERFLDVLGRSAGPICDDCGADAAGFSNRQQAFQLATQLAGQGVIGRDRRECATCGRVKNSSWMSVQGIGAQRVASPALTPRATEPEFHHSLWHWEGNVQGVIVGWLRAEQFGIERVADTASKEQGHDIVAVSPAGRRLLISAKGFPDPSLSSRYVYARHLFADGVLDLLRYRHQSDDIDLALGLPDGFTTYLALAKQVSWLRLKLPFSIFWGSENGSVRVQRPED